jgi:polysaccharide biosynthesis protein PelB
VSTTNAQPPRIAPAWLIALLSGAVLGALYLVTPRGDIRQRVEATGSPSSLSVAYLEAWSRVQPDNETFMTVLASQYAHLGRIDDAERMAERLDTLRSDDAHRTAAFVRVAIAEQRYFALSGADARRPAALAEWRARIAAAAKVARAEKDLSWLATRAAASGDPRLAAQLYAQLSSADSKGRPQWDTYVARYALEGGEYRLAAEAWFRKQDAARDRDDARRCFLSGIGALRAGNLMDDAVAAAEAHLGSLADDPATLVELVNLARAANRPDAVDRFAKMLAKYAKADGAPARGASQQRAYAYMDGPLPARGAQWSARAAVVMRGEQMDGYGVIRIAAAAPAPAADNAHANKAKPSPADVAYGAFVEAGDMASAEQLAKAQVERNPGSALWTQRLAQSAQWNRDPAVALHAWLAYARISNDPAAWGNVLRMAPMLNDDEAYLAAAERDARAAPGDLKKIDAVTSTLERLGRPDEAIAFLRSLPRGKNADALDTRIGQLAERAGHDDVALEAYRSAQTHRPRDVDAALRTASVLYRKGDYRGAFSTLRAASPAATDGDAAYWRNYGELARLLKRDDEANLAYRHLLAGKAATPDDLGDMTHFYEPYPIDAARVAELRFRRDHSMLALQDAIYYYTEAGATDRIEKLFASLDASERQAVQTSPAVLSARAEYYRLTGRPGEAIADLRAALSLPGANSDTRSAYLWMLVDYGSDAEVGEALRRMQGSEDTSAAMWGPLAAAAMRLHKPVVALGYLRRQSASLSRDPLWLLTYADAQEMAGRSDLAWSIRHKVWQQLARDRNVTGGANGARQSTRATRGAQPAEVVDELRGRRVALSTTFATGDASLAMLDDLLSGDKRHNAPEASRSLLGTVDGLPGPGTLDRRELAHNARLRHAVAKDVAIAWALSREANPLAKRWLAQQYAARLSQPADSQLAIALADNDEAQMKRLLDEARSRLPLYERIDAASAIDRPGEAQQLAFTGLEGAPADDELHTRLVDTMLAWPQSIDASVTNHVEHPLDYVEQTLAASRKLSDRYMVGVEGVQRFMRSTDQTQLVNVPSTERSIAFSLRRQTLDSMFAVTGGRREALNSFYTLQLAAQTGRNGPLEVGLRLGRNQTVDENQLLFVGGMKDNAIGDFTWRLTQRISLTGSVEASRFYSQSRNYLGSGLLTSGELSYRIRTNYPDYTVRLVGAHGDYHASGSADDLVTRLVPIANRPVTASDLMPQTYTQYGLFFGFGDDLRTRYTRAWRPFLDVGIMHDSNQGWGPGASIGLAGSVLGGDHAALFFEHQRVSRQGTPVTQVGARYSWFY